MSYSRSQLVVLTKSGKWEYSRYNIGDLVLYEDNVYRIQGFTVLQTDPAITYDIGIGRNISEDELQDYDVIL